MLVQITAAENVSIWQKFAKECLKSVFVLSVPYSFSPTRVCNGTLAILKHLKRFPTVHVRKNLTESLILSQLDYCNVVFNHRRNDSKEYNVVLLVLFVSCRYTHANTCYYCLSGYLLKNETILRSPKSNLRVSITKNKNLFTLKLRDLSQCHSLRLIESSSKLDEL